MAGEHFGIRIEALGHELLPLPVQIEEELALDLGCADLHHAEIVHDEFEDVGLDPEGGIIGKLDALVRVKLVQGVDKAHVALLHKIEHVLHPAALEVHGNLHNQAQMRGNELEGRFLVLGVAKAHCELVLLLWLQERKAADLAHVDLEVVPDLRKPACGRCRKGRVRVLALG